MDRCRKSGVRNSWRAVRKDFVQTVRGELTDHRIQRAVVVLAACRRSIGQRLINEINTIVAVSPPCRQQRHQMTVPTGNDVQFRIWTPGGELEPRKFAVRINLFFVHDTPITECLQDGHDQRTKRMSNQIVRLKSGDDGLVPVQPNVSVDVCSWNAKLCGQIDRQRFGTLQDRIGNRASRFVRYVLSFVSPPQPPHRR